MVSYLPYCVSFQIENGLSRADLGPDWKILATEVERATAVKLMRPSTSAIQEDSSLVKDSDAALARN